MGRIYNPFYPLKMVTRLTVVFSLFMVCVLTGLSFGQQPTASDERVLTKMKKLLGESAIPEGVRRAPIIFTGKDKNGSCSYEIKRDDVAATEIADSLVLFPRGGDVTDFFLNLTKLETEVSAEPDWNQVVANLDSLVQKYFGDLKRDGDWQAALGNVHLNRGVFSLAYQKVEQDVEVQRVDIEVRLGSGKIASIMTTTLPQAPGEVIPPAVPHEKIIAAVQRTLTTDLIKDQVKIEKAARMSGGVNRQNKAVYYYSLTLKTKNKQNQDVLIFGLYEEAKDAFNLESTRIVPSTTVATSITRRMPTQVQDTNPFWSEDGNILFFNSTRDIKGRPWWQRTATVTSILALNKTGLSAIRPLKPLGADFNSFHLLTASSHYLTFKTNDKGFGVLDLQKGQFYLPQRIEPRENQPDTIPASIRKRINDNFEFDVDSATWMKNERALIASFYLDPVDRNLYLMRAQPVSQVQSFEITPVVKEEGEDLLPRLSTDNSTLAWFHQPPITKDRPNSSWDFCVAPFDSQKGEISPRQRLALDSEPLSLSWDNRNRCWLVVTQSFMAWIQQDPQKLSLLRVPDLKWEQKMLYPRSAAISPDGAKIAVAAELQEPQIYKETEVSVQSLVFGWDGKGQQVKPLYEPSIMVFLAPFFLKLIVPGQR